jgi:hypothetical protein
MKIQKIYEMLCLKATTTLTRHILLHWNQKKVQKSIPSYVSNESQNVRQSKSSNQNQHFNPWIFSFHLFIHDQLLYMRIRHNSNINTWFCFINNNVSIHIYDISTACYWIQKQRSIGNVVLLRAVNECASSNNTHRWTESSTTEYHGHRVLSNISMCIKDKTSCFVDQSFLVRWVLRWSMFFFYRSIKRFQ